MDNILEKIEKLFKLAASDNANEAALASAKALELLTKYNLTKAKVDENAQKNFAIKVEPIKGNKAVDDAFIMPFLQEFFFVKVLYTHSERVYEFIGKPENIKVALYVRAYLKTIFLSLYKKQAKLQGWTHGRNKSAFYLGLAKGLREKLNAAKSTDADGLLVINAELNKFVSSLYPNLKTKAGRSIRGSHEAVSVGTAIGRRINISKGITSNSKNSNKQIKGVQNESNN